MKLTKTIYITLIAVILSSSCSQSNTQRLAAKKWKVEKAFFEMKEKYMREDTLVTNDIKTDYSGRVYEFKTDGSFTVTATRKTISGKWNFEKDDTETLYHDMGTQQMVVVMRSADKSFEEVWMPIAGKSIFVNYSDKAEDDRIDVVVMPAIVEGGNMYLYLGK